MQQSQIEKIPDAKRCELCGQRIDNAIQADDKAARVASLIDDAALEAQRNPMLGWAILACVIGGMSTRTAWRAWSNRRETITADGIAKALAVWRKRTRAKCANMCNGGSSQAI